MTRVHALVVVLLLLTVVIHATLAGLVTLVARLARTRKYTSSPPPGVGPAEPITTDGHVDIDRAVSSNRNHDSRRGIAIYATCAGCGMPISLTHSRRRGLRP
jgi:hypothetical protein